MRNTGISTEQTEQLFDLLDEMAELIYVADMDNYDLLYLNTIGQQTFHLENYHGMKCYEALQNRSEPCPFCSNVHLTRDRIYRWEFSNEITGRHYILKDKEIRWKGRRARIEIAVDASEQAAERETLREALNSEHMILECVRCLSATSHLDQALQMVLERIGTYFGADRSYIYRIQGKCVSNTHEWCADSVRSYQEATHKMDVSVLRYWKQRFKEEGCLVILNREDIRKDSPEDYQALSEQGIHRLVAVPLEMGGQLIGFMGVDNPPVEKIKNISPRFQTLAEFMVFAIRISEDEAKLKKLSFRDSLTGVFNRNRYLRDLEEFAKADTPIGIVFLDLNGLKAVNDQKGHDQGDQFLIKCARKASSMFGEDYLYRVGGDEFIILRRNIRESEFLRLAEQLKQVFDGSEDCSVAVGYQWAPSSQRMGQLIKGADEMMYKNKREHYHGLK